MKPRISADEIAPKLERYILEATDEQVEFGKRWYHEAHNHARDVMHATLGEATLEQAAYVIAALSPQLPWPRNKTLALEVANCWADDRNDYGFSQARALGYLKDNIAKAWKILNGDLNALRGPKVEAFAANILGDYDQVTLDTWAFKAAGFDTGYVGSKYQRAEVDKAYRTVAERYGFEPAIAQAIVWTAVNPYSMKGD